MTTCWSPPANSRYLAQHLHDVRYVELEGTDHPPWVGDNERFFAEVDRFLSSDHPAQSRSARLLQALLATGRALDTSLLGMIERFRGRPATSRSGVIYTFDGAIRAVDCALALMDQQPTLWLSVHAGELEIRAGTISGPVVDAATRGSNGITPWARDGHQRRQGSRPRLQPPLTAGPALELPVAGSCSCSLPPDRLTIPAHNTSTERITQSRRPAAPAAARHDPEGRTRQKSAVR